MHTLNCKITPMKSCQQANFIVFNVLTCACMFVRAYVHVELLICDCKLFLHPGVFSGWSQLLLPLVLSRPTNPLTRHHATYPSLLTAEPVNPNCSPTTLLLIPAQIPGLPISAVHRTICVHHCTFSTNIRNQQLNDCQLRSANIHSPHSLPSVKDTWLAQHPHLILSIHSCP